MPVTIPDTVLQIDGAILLFIQNNLRSPALTPFFKAVADYGVIVLGVYVALMLLWEKRRIFPIASACVISGLLGNFFKDYLKKLIMRPRPFLDVPSLVPAVLQGTPPWPLPWHLSSIAFCRSATASPRF